jgi:hypothetical protein
METVEGRVRNNICESCIIKNQYCEKTCNKFINWQQELNSMLDELEKEIEKLKDKASAGIEGYTYCIYDVKKKIAELIGR